MTHQQAVERHAAERYLLDEMPELERYAFEEHYFGCAVCAEDVRAGAVMRDGIAEGMLSGATGARSQEAGARTPAEAHPVAVPRVQDPRAPGFGAAPRGREWRGALPWAVAAMLALTLGYQAFWVVPGLRLRTLEPTVLSPVTLRGATRGAAPTLTRPATGVISLAVDLGAIAAGARLTYDLRAADGTSVTSGTAAAPPPGTPLLLLIPASALQAEGTYVLSVSADPTGSATGEYRFEVTSEK